MKVYMSLWTNGIGFLNTHINLWKLSLALTQKHYGEVNLITNSVGYDIMKNLPFSNFYVELDDIPNYPTVWSLGKIYAYQYACSIGQPFLHLDADVLLWEPLPESLVNSNIFTQSYDHKINENKNYDIYRLQADCNAVVPQEWLNNIGLTAYNMGIFGGSDTTLINSYCDFVIDMINDPMYHNLWTNPPGTLSASQTDRFSSPSTKSCLVEQGNLAIFCKNNNITPSLLFEEMSDPEKITYKKYTHLTTQKNESIILERITNRVSQNPYDLDVRDVPIEDWHTIS